MKPTDLPSIWQSPQLAPYARALARLKETLEEDSAHEMEICLWQDKIYMACGAPFGWRQGKLLWYRFERWATVN